MAIVRSEQTCDYHYDSEYDRCDYAANSQYFLMLFKEIHIKSFFIMDISIFVCVGLNLSSKPNITCMHALELYCIIRKGYRGLFGLP